MLDYGVLRPTHPIGTPLERIDAATLDLDPPFAAVDTATLDSNAADLVRRAGGKPIRIASKSIRCRAVIERAFASNLSEGNGFRGIMAYSVREAIWLARAGAQDVLMGYPTVDKVGLAEVTQDHVLAGRITFMVDDVAHLNALRAAAGSDLVKPRICLDVDASLHVGPLHLGVRRSPLREPHELAQFAKLAHRRGFRVVGIMFYEAQIAGLPDSSFAVEWVKKASATELATRRSAVVTAVTDAVGPLEIVNSGGTGSLEVSSADPSVTEVTAGSGFYLPTLFDNYKAFTGHPAFYFTQPAVRKPAHGFATVFGGGYPASGPASKSRLPMPVGWSNAVRGLRMGGLKLLRNEGAGEVQTPLAVTGNVAIGDRVWFRHAKAGEVCERFMSVYLVDPDGSRTEVPTYRGEGKAFG